MRPDKSDALRRRLRQGTLQFDFGALLEGVSTVDEEPSDQEETVAAPVTEREAGAATDSRTPVAGEGEDRERLKTALDTLGSRLLEEAGRLRSALEGGQPEDGGYYLARVNHLLEILGSMDPGGETARRLGVTAAPPEGRSWPRACWTLYEFAESPLSGLLPADADEMYAAAVIEAAVAVPEG